MKVQIDVDELCRLKAKADGNDEGRDRALADVRATLRRIIGGRDELLITLTKAVAERDALLVKLAVTTAERDTAECALSGNARKRGGT